MAVNFPNSPTNGQTVTVDGVTYSWNAAGSVWDIVTTATATVAVTAPVTNTGTSTAAVLGFATNPSLSGAVNTNGGYKIDSSSQYKAYEYFNSGTRRAVLYTEETQQQLVIQNEGTGPVVIQNGGQNRMNIGNNGHITMPAQPVISGSLTNTTNLNAAANNFSILTNIGFTVGADRITVPTAGNYLVTYNTISNSSTGRVDAAIFFNGTNQVQTLTEDNGTGFHQRSMSVVRALAANDFIQFTNTNWYSNGTTGYVEWRTFSITKLS